MSGVKTNKRRGHRAESEAGRITALWPLPWTMERSGLDGGHDLRGPFCVGEVKAVKSGPAWLQKGLDQLDAQRETRMGVLLVRLDGSGRKPARWLVVMDMTQFMKLIEEQPNASRADMPAALVGD